MAHEGEAIIPAANNPYNPAASKPSGLEGGGIQVNINNITANSREEGAMAGEAFGDAFIMKLRENGYNG